MERGHANVSHTIDTTVDLFTDCASKLVENKVYTSIFGRCVYSLCLYHSATFEMAFTLTVSICGLYFVRVDGEVNLSDRKINQKLKTKFPQ